MRPTDEKFNVLLAGTLVLHNSPEDPRNYIKRISARLGVSERTAGTEKGSAARRELGDFTQDLPSLAPFVLEGKKKKTYLSVKRPGNNKKAEATFS